jgi:hypothetical protein
MLEETMTKQVANDVGSPLPIKPSYRTPYTAAQELAVSDLAKNDSRATLLRNSRWSYTEHAALNYF